MEDKICSDCRIPLVQRKDDNPKAIMKRFKEYKKKTEPVLAYLEKNVPQYYVIDASPSVEKINKEVLRILNIHE